MEPVSDEVRRLPMAVKVYLITDCTCVLLATLNLIGNIIILYLFSTKRLDSRRNLRIILYMAITDIMFSVMILPQLVYMISNWDPDQVSYDATIMASTGWPLPLFLKISAGLTFGAALERILALYFPMLYRKVDHVRCSNILITLSVILGLFDTILAVLSFRFETRLNCSSIGCFVNSNFRTFWGASNMTCGILIIVCSVFVFFKVQKMSRQTGQLTSQVDRKKSTVLFESKATNQKFRQANRTTCGVLFSCLFCLTIPSMMISLVETIFGFSVFEKVGAFYAGALLANGLMNCSVFLALNGSIVKTTNRTRTTSEGAITTAASSKPISNIS